MDPKPGVAKWLTGLKLGLLDVGLSAKIAKVGAVVRMAPKDPEFAGDLESLTADSHWMRALANVTAESAVDIWRRWRDRVAAAVARALSMTPSRAARTLLDLLSRATPVADSHPAAGPPDGPPPMSVRLVENVTAAPHGPTAAGMPAAA